MAKSVKNWRKINSNMIQTYAKEVYLWDNGNGVFCRVAVPSRPWKKIDPDFTHWFNADGFPANYEPDPPLVDGTVFVSDDGVRVEVHSDGSDSVVMLIREDDEF